MLILICYGQSGSYRIDIGLRLRSRLIIDKSVLLNGSRYLTDTDRSRYRRNLGAVLSNRLGLRIALAGRRAA
jgi:hypothetical protein